MYMVGTTLYLLNSFKLLATSFKKFHKHELALDTLELINDAMQRMGQGDQLGKILLINLNYDSMEEIMPSFTCK